MNVAISVTQAVRNFADVVNRVLYRGESFLLERGGRPVARLVPVPRGARLGDLPDLLEGVPDLGSSDAEALSRDLEKAREDLLSLPEEDPWGS